MTTETKADLLAAWDAEEAEYIADVQTLAGWLEQMHREHHTGDGARMDLCLREPCRSVVEYLHCREYQW